MKQWAAAPLLVLGCVMMAAVPAPTPVATSGLSLSGTPVQGGGVLSGTAPAGTVDLRLGDQPVPVDSDGRFLIGFDRDAGPQAHLVARFADGRVVDRPLTVAPRAWRIEHVDAPPRPVRENETFLALRRPELEQIAQARARATDAAGWRQHFIWPRNGRISGLFGAQRVYQGTPGAYHGGIDVAGAVGDPVVAPADGVVVLAAAHPFTLEGNLLMIDHGHGLVSAFLHLSRINVKAGQHVNQGQRIGAIGATGPHLHWGLRWNEARIDPLLLMHGPPAN